MTILCKTQLIFVHETRLMICPWSSRYSGMQHISRARLSEKIKRNSCTYSSARVSDLINKTLAKLSFFYSVPKFEQRTVQPLQLTAFKSRFLKSVEIITYIIYAGH